MTARWRKVADCKIHNPAGGGGKVHIEPEIIAKRAKPPDGNRSSIICGHINSNPPVTTGSGAGRSIAPISKDAGREVRRWGPRLR